MLRSSESFQIEGDIVYVSVDHLFVRVDFMPEHVLRPYSRIPVGYRPQAILPLRELIPSQVPYIGVVDLLVTKILCSGARIFDHKREADAMDVDLLAIYIIGQKGFRYIPLSAEQKQVVTVSLEGILGSSNTRRGGGCLHFAFGDGHGNSIPFSMFYFFCFSSLMSTFFRLYLPNCTLNYLFRAFFLLSCLCLLSLSVPLTP